MSSSNAKSAAIAAIIILAVVIVLFLAMPSLVIAAGDVSAWLGFAIIVLFVLGFFAVFFLRARYQRKRDGR